MNRDQILDLFSSEPEAKPKESTNLKMTTKEVMENLSQLWDESEYDEFEMNAFLKNL
jgi:hypothetical protein